MRLADKPCGAQTIAEEQESPAEKYAISMAAALGAHIAGITLAAELTGSWFVISMTWPSTARGAKPLRGERQFATSILGMR